MLCAGEEGGDALGESLPPGTDQTAGQRVEEEG